MEHHEVKFTWNQFACTCLEIEIEANAFDRTIANDDNTLQPIFDNTVYLNENI